MNEDASSLHRNSAVLAMSRGEGRTPSGSDAAALVVPRLLRCGVVADSTADDACEHLSRDVGGPDRIDPNLVRRQFGRKGSGQHPDCRFRHAVDAGGWPLGSNGRERHDVAARATFNHQLSGTLSSQEHAAYVHVVDVVEMVGVEIEKASEAGIGMRGNASRRDADVDPADLRRCMIDGCSNRAGIQHVTGDKRGERACVVQLLGDRHPTLSHTGEIDDRYRRPFACEAVGDGRAETTGAAGDDRSFAFESSHFTTS